MDKHTPRPDLWWPDSPEDWVPWENLHIVLTGFLRLVPATHISPLTTQKTSASFRQVFDPATYTDFSINYMEKRPHFWDRWIRGCNMHISATCLSPFTAQNISACFGQVCYPATYQHRKLHRKPPHFGDRFSMTRLCNICISINYTVNLCIFWTGCWPCNIKVSPLTCNYIYLYIF